MPLTCGCLGIPETKLREELSKAHGPLTFKEQVALHKKLGGDSSSCCGECRLPEGNRIFSDIVREHNDKKSKFEP